MAQIAEEVRDKVTEKQKEMKSLQELMEGIAERNRKGEETAKELTKRFKAVNPQKQEENPKEPLQEGATTIFVDPTAIVVGEPKPKELPKKVSPVKRKGAYVGRPIQEIYDTLEDIDHNLSTFFVLFLGNTIVGFIFNSFMVYKKYTETGQLVFNFWYSAIAFLVLCGYVLSLYIIREIFIVLGKIIDWVGTELGKVFALEKLKFSFRNINFIKLVLAVLMCVIQYDLSYGQYSIIRFVAMVGFGVIAFDYSESDPAKKLEFYYIFWGASAVLINPIFKVHLGKEMWHNIDSLWCIMLVVSVWNSLKRKNPA